MTYITKEELEATRSASEVRQWVKVKIDEIGTTEEGKQAIRFRKGLLKELIEEALPLGIFCDAYFKSSDNVEVTHISGNQNYDVIIKDNRSNKTMLEYLEITQAHEGENAHYRRLKFEEKGYVNYLGTVKKSGTKHTKINIDIEDEALEHNVVFNNEMQKIVEAAERKSGKFYPAHTGLVIIFDDYIAFKNNRDEDRLITFAKNKILPMLDNFEKIFIVGWSSKIYLEFK